MSVLARIEDKALGSKIEVRTSALIFLLGMIDGLMEGDADIEAIVDLLMEELPA